MPEATINERFLDYQVAQAIRWIRFGNRESKEAMVIMGRIDRELVQLLASPPGGEYTKARLVALQSQITSMMTAIHEGQIRPQIIDMVRTVSGTTGELEAQTFKRLLPAGLDVTTPNLGVLQNAAILQPFGGAPLEEWIQELKDNDIKRTWRTVVDGVTQGRTSEEIIGDIVGHASLRYKDGIREVSRRGVDTLIRTSINHATNVGRQQVWDDNSEIIKGVRWVSTLDSRTTPICRDLDGQIFPVNDGPRPPAHLSCRSTTTAVTKSWKELGFDAEDLPPETRASMNGQVPSDLTYWQWFDRQGQDLQEEVLGPSRYKMWKNGEVPNPTDFANDKGRLYTLEELKRRHG